MRDITRHPAILIELIAHQGRTFERPGIAIALERAPECGEGSATILGDQALFAGFHRHISSDRIARINLALGKSERGMGGGGKPQPSVADGHR